MSLRKKIILSDRVNGEIRTPFFMPDATRGYVKSVSMDDLIRCGVGPMVVNTFHLYLEPGIAKLKVKSEKLKVSGGIHSFMNWPHPLLSDSGGYQVFSLIHKNPKMGKILDDKVIFQSPIDGSKHELTPEKSIKIQFDLGVDMMVCLDDCPPNSYNTDALEVSVNHTIAWAERCRREYDKQIKKRKLKDKERPLLFSVIQGGNEKDLRKYCADELIKIGFDGYGFGARPVDEDGNWLEDILKYTADLIPKDSLRFALGIGMPEDIVRCVSYGWDMFDCVIPTREGRHGRLFSIKQKNNKTKKQGKNGIEIKKFTPLDKASYLTGLRYSPREMKQAISQGKEIISGNKDFYDTININNSKFAKDFSPINENSKLSELREHTKAYLRHLFKMREPMGARLASLNNLEFYMGLMENIRNAKYQGKNYSKI